MIEYRPVILYHDLENTGVNADRRTENEQEVAQRHFGRLRMHRSSRQQLHNSLKEIMVLPGQFLHQTIEFS